MLVVIRFYKVKVPVVGEIALRVRSGFQLGDLWGVTIVGDYIMILGVEWIEKEKNRYIQTICFANQRHNLPIAGADRREEELQYPSICLVTGLVAKIEVFSLGFEGLPHSRIRFVKSNEALEPNAAG